MKFSNNFVNTMKIFLLFLTTLIAVNSSIYAQSITFSASKTNTFGFTNVDDWSKPSFVDIDNDGDFDAFVGEELGDIYYFENVGSQSSPSFDSPKINTFGFIYIDDNSAPSFVDIDNDGDFDAFVGGISGDLFYFENVGTQSSPSFTSPKTNTFGFTNVNTFINSNFVDIDNDGDFDAFVGEFNGNLFYFENVGSQSSPSFTSPKTNTFGFTNVGGFSAPSFVDIDNDGDFDAFVGGISGNLFYFENVGSQSSPSFKSLKSNTFGFTGVGIVSAPSFVDIDNDSDFDSFVGNGSGDIYYFENISSNSLSLADVSFDDISENSVEFSVNVSGVSESTTITFEYGTISEDYSNTINAGEVTLNGVVSSSTTGLNSADQYFVIARASTTASSTVTSDETSFWTLDTEPNQVVSIIQTNENIGTSEISLSWTNSGADSYLVLKGESGAEIASSNLPNDATSYTVSTDIGNLEVIANTTGNTFTSGNLQKNQSFFFAVVPYNEGEDDQTINYNTADVPTITGFTIPTLGEWGMIVFGGLMLLVGVWQVRRVV